MAKKGGLFGSLFDFNHDGRVDSGEQFIAYQIFQECTKPGKRNTGASHDRYHWRSLCEDGSEYALDPEDYETEEEYEEALEEAKYGWRDTCEDGSEYALDPEDYETEEEYEEALDEAKYGWR